jgi:membrane protein DedA with SNARE-associated domain
LKQFFAALFATLLAWGPLGTFVLSILDSAGVPIPEGVDFLVIAVAAQGARQGYLAAALAVAGSVIGSLFLFYVARRGGHAYLEKRTQKGWPRRFRQWFHHYGGLAVFIPVALPAPLPLKVFVISAGALSMRPLHFVLLVFAGRALRYFALAYLGVQMGTLPWQYVKTHGWQLAAISLGIFAVLYAAVRFKDYLRLRAHHHQLHHHAE